MTITVDKEFVNYNGQTSTANDGSGESNRYCIVTNVA